MTNLVYHIEHRYNIEHVIHLPDIITEYANDSSHWTCWTIVLGLGLPNFKWSLRELRLRGEKTQIFPV